MQYRRLRLLVIKKTCYDEHMQVLPSKSLNLVGGCKAIKSLFSLGGQMKSIIKKSVAVAAIALAASTGAQASDTNWATHDSFEAGIKLKWGSFADNYSFTISGPSLLDSSLAAAFGGGSYSLFSFGSDHLRGTADDVSFGSWSFNSFHNTASLNDSGSYYYNVAGRLFGGYVLTSSLESVTAPVPEPETYAMLIAGLGLMGVVARRRKQKAG